MYGVVADALKKAGLSNHPKDYLNFYCLGKREPQTFDTSTSTQSFDNRALVCQSTFHIEIHVKSLIFVGLQCDLSQGSSFCCHFALVYRMLRSENEKLKRNLAD